MRRSKRDIEERVRYLSPDEHDLLVGALKLRDDNARNARKSANEWRTSRGRPVLPEIGEFADYLTPLVVLALNTGMRRGELLKLRWNDVNLPDRQLTVRARTGKSGRKRHLPLNKEAVRVLDELNHSKKSAERVFSVHDPSKAWNNMIESTGIEDFHFHDLRHTFASWLVMRGIDLNTVRELLGHSDLKMTLRYAHLAPGHKAMAVAVLDD